jgi:hypothetical protein
MALSSSGYFISGNSSEISRNIMETFKYENFLDPNECLVYIRNTSGLSDKINKSPIGDTNGITHIARIVRSYILNDTLWYDIVLVTDSEGYEIPGARDATNNIRKLTVSGDRVLTNRSIKDIDPREMYHFTTIDISDGINYPITANNFVIKKNLESPLEHTSRSALGSGIYGRYIQDPSDIESFLLDSNQLVYKIDCPNAYIIQDEEHGESITTASLNTNRYLDDVIQSLRGNNITDINDALVFIDNNSHNLVTLWNIVFYRTHEIITKDTLDYILASYAIRYLTDDYLVDSVNGEILQELPINDIMREFGYEGLLASDIYNNGWNRGCVSYNYSQASIIRGDTAKY